MSALENEVEETDSEHAQLFSPPFRCPLFHSDLGSTGKWRNVQEEEWRSAPIEYLILIDYRYQDDKTFREVVEST